ncbi:scaffold attachment factor b-related [Anaeramoeba flamelloides]|uniref:Scaffold attachment factor b-related n=1 Tax=Anaeramoeba flamelloides TaxID=1746091 RepID=A0ABQ8Z0F2_9EUKA|nr:scaffold attachment factor b-related [Anaeramoeba flamelloides]
MNIFIQTCLSQLLEEWVVISEISDSITLSISLCKSINKQTPNTIHKIDKEDSKRNYQNFLDALKKRSFPKKDLPNLKNLIELGINDPKLPRALGLLINKHKLGKKEVSTLLKMYSVGKYSFKSAKIDEGGNLTECSIVLKMDSFQIQLGSHGKMESKYSPRPIAVPVFDSPNVSQVLFSDNCLRILHFESMEVCTRFCSSLSLFASYPSRYPLITGLNWTFLPQQEVIKAIILRLFAQGKIVYPCKLLNSTGSNSNQYHLSITKLKGLSIIETNKNKNKDNRNKHKHNENDYPNSSIIQLIHKRKEIQVLIGQPFQKSKIFSLKFENKLPAFLIVSLYNKAQLHLLKNKKTINFNQFNWLKINEIFSKRLYYRSSIFSTFNKDGLISNFIPIVYDNYFSFTHSFILHQNDNNDQTQKMKNEIKKYLSKKKAIFKIETYLFNEKNQKEWSSSQLEFTNKKIKIQTINKNKNKGNENENENEKRKGKAKENNKEKEKEKEEFKKIFYKTYNNRISLIVNPQFKNILLLLKKNENNIFKPIILIKTKNTEYTELIWNTFWNFSNSFLNYNDYTFKKQLIENNVKKNPKNKEKILIYSINNLNNFQIGKEILEQFFNIFPKLELIQKKFTINDFNNFPDNQINFNKNIEQVKDEFKNSKKYHIMIFNSIGEIYSNSEILLNSKTFVIKFKKDRFIKKYSIYTNIYLFNKSSIFLKFNINKNYSIIIGFYKLKDKESFLKEFQQLRSKFLINHYEVNNHNNKNDDNYNCKLINYNKNKFEKHSAKIKLKIDHFQILTKNDHFNCNYSLQTLETNLNQKSKNNYYFVKLFVWSDKYLKIIFYNKEKLINFLKSFEKNRLIYFHYLYNKKLKSNYLINFYDLKNQEKIISENSKIEIKPNGMGLTFNTKTNNDNDNDNDANNGDDNVKEKQYVFPKEIDFKSLKKKSLKYKLKINNNEKYLIKFQNENDSKKFFKNLRIYQKIWNTYHKTIQLHLNEKNGEEKNEKMKKSKEKDIKKEKEIEKEIKKENENENENKNENENETETENENENEIEKERKKENEIKKTKVKIENNNKKITLESENKNNNLFNYQDIFNKIDNETIFKINIKFSKQKQKMAILFFNENKILIIFPDNSIQKVSVENINIMSNKAIKTLIRIQFLNNNNIYIILFLKEQFKDNFFKLFDTIRKKNQKMNQKNNTINIIQKTTEINKTPNKQNRTLNINDKTTNITNGKPPNRKNKKRNIKNEKKESENESDIELNSIHTDPKKDFDSNESFSFTSSDDEINKKDNVLATPKERKNGDHGSNKKKENYKENDDDDEDDNIFKRQNKIDEDTKFTEDSAEDSVTFSDTSEYDLNDDSEEIDDQFDIDFLSPSGLLIGKGILRFFCHSKYIQIINRENKNTTFINENIKIFFNENIELIIKLLVKNQTLIFKTKNLDDKKLLIPKLLAAKKKIHKHLKLSKKNNIKLQNIIENKNSLKQKLFSYIKISNLFINNKFIKKIAILKIDFINNKFIFKRKNKKNIIQLNIKSKIKVKKNIRKTDPVIIVLLLESLDNKQRKNSKKQKNNVTASRIQFQLINPEKERKILNLFNLIYFYHNCIFNITYNPSSKNKQNAILQVDRLGLNFTLKQKKRNATKLIPYRKTKLSFIKSNKKSNSKSKSNSNSNSKHNSNSNSNDKNKNYQFQFLIKNKSIVFLTESKEILRKVFHTWKLQPKITLSKEEINDINFTSQKLLQFEKDYLKLKKLSKKLKKEVNHLDDDDDDKDQNNDDNKYDVDEKNDKENDQDLNSENESNSSSSSKKFNEIIPSKKYTGRVLRSFEKNIIKGSQIEFLKSSKLIIITVLEQQFKWKISDLKCSKDKNPRIMKLTNRSKNEFFKFQLKTSEIRTELIDLFSKK